eukprot:SAG25_NODE_3768_length_976_cov_1.010262_2_plen_78_part_00
MTPRLFNFTWSVALGVAVVPRHDRCKLEGLEWRLAALRSHRRLELAALLDTFSNAPCNAVLKSKLSQRHADFRGNCT